MKNRSQDWGRSADSDEARFEDVYLKTAGYIVSYCARRLGPNGDPEDAAADVYVIAWRRRRDLFTADAPLAWLYAVAHGVVRNHHRTRHRFIRLIGRIKESNSRSTVPGFSERVATEVDAQREAIDLLERLDPIDKEIVCLLSWEDLQPKEIAQVVEMPESTVRSRLFRLRQTFAPGGHDPSGDQGGAPRGGLS